MDTKLILERLEERHDIKTLNPMQAEMAATDARRIILLAPTGSGKTAAFIIRVLRFIGPSAAKVQAVILAPTRELALQIGSVIRPVAAGLKTVVLYGGHNMADEVKSLSPLPDIIVATPGRLLDHLQRRNVDVSTASALVLDEYDKSLELGFYDDMKRIIKRMPAIRLSVLSSATPIAEMPDFIDMRGAETFDYNAAGAKSRLQVVRVPSADRDKIGTLEALLRALPNGKALVFVNHRESAERVYNILKNAGFPVGLYHGGLEQRERQLAIDKFNNGSTPIVVLTDLGARGLDIDNVNYVIHYHLPLTPESWTHRNGRTARQQAEGTAFVIIHEDENIPEAVSWDRDYIPASEAPEGTGIHADFASIYINAGKKEKISRGDIAGYFIHKGGLDPQELGKIAVSDHSSIVAVPAAKARALIATLAPYKLKNTRVKLSLI